VGAAVGLICLISTGHSSSPYSSIKPWTPEARDVGRDYWIIRQIADCHVLDHAGAKRAQIGHLNRPV